MPNLPLRSMPGNCTAFATPAVVSKRPRSKLFSLHPSSRGACHRGRHGNVWRAASAGKHGRVIPRMTTGESLVRTAPDNEERVGSGGFVPEGAFTILLQVKIRDGVTVADAKSVLSEYARKTCAEQRVLRCDILYEVSSRGTAKGRFYEIWIAFEDAAAYAEHEKTSHAAKLRVWLENPAGGDSAMMLTKLSYSSSILEPLRPAAADWKSGINYAVEDEDERNQRMSDATMDLIRGSSSNLSGNVRKSLEVLISNVGLENVTVLIASSTATSADIMPSLTGICEEYVEDQENNAGIVRTGILVERNNPLRIFVMTVHDSESKDGAFFDTDMAADLIQEDGWTVKRYFPVFPDKIGWERPAPPESPEEETEPMSYLGPIQEATDIVGETKAPGTSASNCRLLQGAGAFEMLKPVIREMTKKPTGEIKAMIICGWNAARVQPLLVQMQLLKDKDPGLISFKFGLSVEDCDANTKLLKKGMDFLRENQPDVVLAYGGGAVIDMAKALGLLGHATGDEIEEFVSKINEAADNDVGRVQLNISNPPIPVMLIPTTIGPGAELTEICIIKGCPENGVSRRMCVDFVNTSNIPRHANERVIMSDSRLVGPRRYFGIHAAQGALLLLCRGIEVLLSMYEHKSNQAVEQAEQSIAGASETVLAAFREPRKGSGESRDPLTYAQTKIGLAADCAGKIGLCTRLSLAVLDELKDELHPHCFRTVLIRVTAGLMTEICSMDNDAARQFSDRVAKAMLVATPEAAVKKMLARAGDVDVRLLPEIGMLRRSIPVTAQRVVKTVLQEEELSTLERTLADEQIMERVLHNALDQQYEL